MKKNTMKKLFVLTLSLAMTLSLAACGKQESSSQGEQTGRRIAIVQQMSHPSLDEIQKAISDRLAELGSEAGEEILVEIYNGNGNANQLD